jgi:RimJ/RimL family protein N-acetyltransferase
MAASSPPLSESVTLRDGSRLTIRPIRPDDAPRLQAFHLRLSPTSIHLRFLSSHPLLSATEAERLANVDYQTRMAFVATRPAGRDESIVGVARYDVPSPTRPDEAEPAIVIEDAYQGRGLGAVLADRLLDYARRQGIGAFVAEINAENEHILDFIRRSGLPAQKKLEGGILQIQVKIA